MQTLFAYYPPIDARVQTVCIQHPFVSPCYQLSIDRLTLDHILDIINMWPKDNVELYLYEFGKGRVQIDLKNFPPMESK